MWFKKSSVQLSAAMVLALCSYPNSVTGFMTASLFFIMGMNQRRHEKAKEDEKTTEEV